MPSQGRFPPAANAGSRSGFYAPPFSVFEATAAADFGCKGFAVRLEALADRARAAGPKAGFRKICLTNRPGGVIMLPCRCSRKPAGKVGKALSRRRGAALAGAAAKP